MEAKHTPGPWAVIEGDFRGVKIEGEDQAEVARCPGDKQGRIDARLIAAAPELLEALSILLEVPQLQGDQAFSASAHIEAARAAIAKATGSAA